MSGYRQHDEELRRNISALDTGTLRWMLDTARLVRDPVFPGLVCALFMIITGLVVLGISGIGITRFDYVPLQLPYLVSGGFGALGLVAAGALLASIFGNRRDQAYADDEFGMFAEELTAFARRSLHRRSSATGEEV